ncbi:MAG: nucleotidyltransferase domain-containing protein [Actinobacteria bacterium]|nr:nucleotidyltransferase domain-containing protein [Actinomycetota bacterium]
MLSTLITSKTRVKLLTLFLTHPDARFYFKNLIERLGVPPSALQTELKKFELIGLLKSEREGNIKFYWVDKSFPLYPELKGIIFKTVGLADRLKEALDKIGHIDVAFIYGSVAKNLEDAKSDIDLMVIGDPDMDALSDVVTAAEHELIREVNYTVFDPKEWKERVAKNNSFVMDVLKNNKIFLIGGEDELRRIAQS